MCLAAPTWGPTWTSSRGSDQRAATPAPAAQPRPSPAAPFRIPGSLASPRTSPSLLPWPRRRPPAAVQAMVEVLRAGGCASLRCVAIQLPAEAPLRALHLDGCRQLAEVLVVASRLESLNLSHCGQLRSLTLRCRWGVRRHDRLAPRWVPPSLWLVTLPPPSPAPPHVHQPTPHIGCALTSGCTPCLPASPRPAQAPARAARCQLQQPHPVRRRAALPSAGGGQPVWVPPAGRGRRVPCCRRRCRPCLLVFRSRDVEQPAASLPCLACSLPTASAAAPFLAASTKVTVALSLCVGCRPGGMRGIPDQVLLPGPHRLHQPASPAAARGHSTAHDQVRESSCGWDGGQRSAALVRQAGCPGAASVNRAEQQAVCCPPPLLLAASPGAACCARSCWPARCCATSGQPGAPA